MTGPEKDQSRMNGKYYIRFTPYKVVEKHWSGLGWVSYEGEYRV
jgi:hypothetical protein